MADNYRKQAEVILKVNSQEAEDKLVELDARANKLREDFARAFKDGDTRGINKINKELNSVNRQIENMRTNAANIKAAMQRLDQASPKDLQKTIKMINNELNSGRVPRCSEQWRMYVDQLRKAKAALAGVKAEMEGIEAPHKTFGQRIKEWQTAIVGGFYTVINAVGKVKAEVAEYVDAFVGMQGEMANVQKYTGMTEEDVAGLNEAFKQMDTRTSREELNKLAQDAGRLGKQSAEDVLGFVRAADQINVALDDLGDGATLTLSKLTGVFGVEQTMGTEAALLSVGSVINELSQNCAASAPYLADFASRVGGVGAQAGMTVQQIMGIASALDANNQNLERSSTALANFITHMFTDPAKYAKAAGIAVKDFTDLLNEDANGAIIKFLEAANKMGGMEALAPMFADLGEKGSGMVATLSSLAGSIDMVKAQQEAANVAFAEATSITAEFNVQNNTAAARLDKAKKNANEMAVTLGEQLYPVMMYCVEGGSLGLKLISNLISFGVKYRNSLLAVAAGVAAYTVAVNIANIATKAHQGWMLLANKWHALTRSAVLLSSAAFNALTGNTTRATAAMRMFNASVAANPVGLLITLLTAAAAAFFAFKRNSEDAAKAQSLVADAEESAAKAAKEETAETKLLYEKTQDVTEAMDKRLAAANRLKALHPETFANLSAEAIVAGEAAGAYRDLTNSILATAKAEAYRAKISENSGKIAGIESNMESTLTKLKSRKNLPKEVREILDSGQSEAEIIARLADYAQRTKRPSPIAVNSSPGAAAEAQKDQRVIIDGLLIELAEGNEKLEALEEANKKLEDKILAVSKSRPAAKSTATDTEADTETGKGTYIHGETEKERKAREKAEREAAKREKEALKKDLDEQKALRDKALAGEMALYSTGTISFAEHEERKHQIEREYFDKQLEVYKSHGMEESAEYAEVLRKKEELIAKHNDTLTKLSLREIEENHRLEVDNITASMFDTNSILYGNERAYRQAMLEETVYYLREKQKLYAEDSEEWANIDRQISEAVAKDQLDKQKETADALSKFESQYRKASGSTREAQELAILDNLHDQQLISEEEYQKARRDIQDKYRKEDAEKATSVKSEYADMVSDLYEAFSKLFESIGKGGQDMWNDLSDAAAASYAVMGAALSQYSAYSNAERDLELAKIERRYKTEIEAAGKNKKEVARLEAAKEAEIAQTKKKYNDRAMKIEIAQAIAQTAQAAISAYASAAAIPVTGWIMAPIAAALATAAGMAQVAIIKKQHEAEAIGYYDGGFTTRDQNDRRVVGNVHANEFVVNSRAVKNPALSPLLQMIDHAQKNNTVARITADDVSNAIGQGRGVSTRAAVTGGAVGNRTTVVNNSISVAPLERLNDLLAQGIEARIPLEGDRGFDHQYTRYKRLKSNSER